MATAVRAPSRWFPFRRYGTVMAIISLSFLFGDAAARRFVGLLLANALPRQTTQGDPRPLLGLLPTDS